MAWFQIIVGGILVTVRLGSLVVLVDLVVWAKFAEI